jgi:hypothetical protein
MSRNRDTTPIFRSRATLERRLDQLARKAQRILAEPGYMPDPDGYQVTDPEVEACHLIHQAYLAGVIDVVDADELDDRMVRLIRGHSDAVVGISWH